MATTGTTTPTPLAIGAHRDFPAGRHVVSVTRTAAHAYRVVVLAHGGHAIDCYTASFSADRIPMDTTPRRAAHDYLTQLVGEFTAATETPAGVVARLAAAA
jgi:hypothetical protein